MAESEEPLRRASFLARSMSAGSSDRVSFVGGIRINYEWNYVCVNFDDIFSDVFLAALRVFGSVRAKKTLATDRRG
jgi:hypothetical protein